MRRRIMVVLMSSLLVSTCGCSMMVSVPDEVSQVTMQTDNMKEQSKRLDSSSEEATSFSTERETSSMTATEKESSEMTESTVAKTEATTTSTTEEKRTEARTEAKTETTTEETTESTTEDPSEGYEVEIPRKPVEYQAYDPNKVVAIANQKLKERGLTLLPEEMDRALADGRLTKEEYDAYYPTAGSGYWMLTVNCNLNEARDVSGTTQFHNESDIADYIAGMTVGNNVSYGYIVYGGTTDFAGKTLYMFYCYRS